MVKRLLVEPTEHYLRRHYFEPKTIAEFLELTTMDVATWEDDFMGDTLHGGYQSTASGAGSAAAAINTGAVNGEIRLTTGTDNAGRSDLSLGLHFRGDQNAIIACRLKISAITSAKFEVGFTDVISGTDAGAVNVLATPSFNADDAVVWAFDTNDTANYKLVGVAATVGATSIAPGFAPVAATYETLLVALLDGTAYFLRADVDGNISYRSAPMAAAVTKTVLLTPWVFVQTRNTTSKNLDIDYLRVWQRRTSTL